MRCISIGIDIGSTIIKVVAWDEKSGMVYSDYVCGTEAICDRSRTLISIKMQGWGGKYLLHELTMLYFIEEFHENSEAVQVCMASRRYSIPV